MEILLVFTVIIFALSYLFEKVSNLIQQLKSGSTKLSKGFEAKLSIVPIDKKSEECATNTNSTSDTLE